MAERIVRTLWVFMNLLGQKTKLPGRQAIETDRQKFLNSVAVPLVNELFSQGDDALPKHHVMHSCQAFTAH